jgi:hypothetical protein
VTKEKEVSFCRWWGRRKMMNTGRRGERQKKEKGSNFKYKQAQVSQQTGNKKNKEKLTPVNAWDL